MSLSQSAVTSCDIEWSDVRDLAVDRSGGLGQKSFDRGVHAARSSDDFSSLARAAPADQYPFGRWEIDDGQDHDDA